MGMADYYPLLVRALDGLTEDSHEGRVAIYDRARGALQDQLRSVHPPLSEGDITRERLALDEAIDRTECEAAQGLIGPGSAARQEPDSSDLSYPEAERMPQGRPRRGADEAAPQVRPSPIMVRDRPRVDSISPSIRRPRSRTSLIAGALLALAVAGIATTAWMLRDKPGVSSTAALLPGEAPAAPVAGQNAADPEAKFADRVSGGGRPSAAAPARGAAAGPPRAEVAVSQRVVLLEENPADPKTPKISNGRGVWRIENINAGQGQPLETVVRADIEVPDANLGLTLQIRRNLDPTLPASHTVLLTFRPDPQNPDRVIKDIGLLQFKNEESVRGTPVAGLPVPVKENVFLIGLSDLRGDVERNLELFSRRNWIDLPIRMAKGQRGILSFEKGVSGEQVVNNALRQWGQL